MSILTTGKKFANGEQLSASKLNQVITGATFNASDAVDGSSITLIGGAIAVNDGGVTFAKLTDVIDSDTMTGASATKLATSESIKAYVDSSAGGFTPSTYAGETSITFPNGLIMKFGTVNVTSANVQSHLFKNAAGNNDPFPTACVYLSGDRDGAESYGNLSITSKDKNGWTGNVQSAQSGTYNYLAYGH